MKTVLRNFVVAAVMAGIVSPLLGGTIRMQVRAVVVEGAVRLGDVATLSGMGSEAEKLAEIVVLENLPKDGAKIRTEQILFAIAAARGVKATANVQISGSAECLVVRQGEEAKFATLSAPSVTMNARGTSESNRTVSVEAISERPVVTAPVVMTPVSKITAAPKKNTLAELLIEQQCTSLAARREDVRVDFETISPWLDMPTPAGQRWQFKTNTRGLGTAQWEAQLLDGTKVVQKVTILGKVAQRQTVVTVTSPVARGDIVTAKDVREEEIWIDRKIATLVMSAGDVIGAEATRSLAAGAMMDTKDIKAPEMAGRGELITVYAVSGSLMIKGSVRATESGKLHDVIRVKNEGTGEIYPATLVGKHLAVVGTLTPEMEKKIKEMH